MVHRFPTVLEGIAEVGMVVVGIETVGIAQGGEVKGFVEHCTGRVKTGLPTVGKALFGEVQMEHHGTKVKNRFMDAEGAVRPFGVVWRLNVKSRLAFNQLGGGAKGGRRRFKGDAGAETKERFPLTCDLEEGACGRLKGEGDGEGVKVDVEDGGTHGKTSLQEKGKEALGDAAFVGLEPVFGEGFEGLG